MNSSTPRTVSSFHMASRAFIIGVALFAMPTYASEKVENYLGKAKHLGELVYIEKHQVTYGSDGGITRALTRYEKPDGTLLVELSSDFSRSLAAPDHVARNHLKKNTNGVRRSNGNLVMFDQDDGQPERTQSIDETKLDGRLLVGCQGLNYYVLRNLESFEQGKRVPLKFIIPAVLDTYDFELRKKESSDPKISEFEIRVQNWFLRLVAPSLLVRYHTETKRITYYEGISNIDFGLGTNKKVTIEYEYPDSSKESK